MTETGMILLPKADGAIECLIQEISATGARLKLAAPHRVPSHFQFTERIAAYGVGGLVGHRGRGHPLYREIAAALVRASPITPVGGLFQRN